MDTKFLNSKNSKISDLHRLLLNLAGKINLKRSGWYVVLSNLYYACKNIKKSCKNNIFKKSPLTWSEEFKLHDGLYFV